ncbi:MAG: IS110 family transposase [Enterocloster clostridioformis]
MAVLLTHGLLRASYIPGKDQRELRELVRYRKSLVGERSRELNRLQKMLEGANIKISGTITDINGKVPGTSWSTYFQENRLTLLNMTFSMK